MELREPIELINEQLIRDFGRHTDGRPNFRVVWSEDQYENRWTNYTDEGFELIHPEVRLLPKYKQYIHGKYILEKLVPIVGMTDLVEKTGYEPAWVFQDKDHNYLPPFFEGCVYIIDSMRVAAGQKGHVKYKDPNIDPELREKALQKVQDELFGNETTVGDHLRHGTGVFISGDDENSDLKKEAQLLTSKIELNKLVN